MLILDTEMTLTESDTKTNVIIPFVVPLITARQERPWILTVYFRYTPNQSSDSVARRQVKEGIQRYVMEEYSNEYHDVARYLPVDNLITLSLSKEGNYLGGHHNKSNDQIIQISQEDASHGFWPATVEPAQWELQLNCHCIASEQVQVHIQMEVTT